MQPRILIGALVAALTGCGDSTQEQLIDALYDDDVTAAQRALADGANPNARLQDDEFTATQIAALDGSTAMLTLLLEAGGDPGSTTDDGETLSQLALGSCQPGTFDAAIAGGAPPPTKPGVLPQTVLDCQSIEFLDWYVERNPPTRVPDHWIASLPVPKAEDDRKRELRRIDRWVTAFGAGDPDALANALYNAVSAHDRSRVTHLIALGARPSAWTLRRASRRAAAIVPDASASETARLERELADLRAELVAAGADVKATIDGTPVLFSVSANPSALALFLQHGADPDQVDRRGRTALHHLAADIWFPAGNAETQRRVSCESLIAAGASIDARDKEGRSPLHAAAREARRSLVSALLAAGARTDAIDDDGKTAADLARERLPSRPTEDDHAGKAFVALTGLGAIIDARLERYREILALLGEPLPEVSIDEASEKPGKRALYKAIRSRS